MIFSGLNTNRTRVAVQSVQYRPVDICAAAPHIQVNSRYVILHKSVGHKHVRCQKPETNVPRQMSLPSRNCHVRVSRTPVPSHQCNQSVRIQHGCDTHHQQGMTSRDRLSIVLANPAEGPVRKIY